MQDNIIVIIGQKLAITGYPKNSGAPEQAAAVNHAGRGRRSATIAYATR